MSTIIIPALSGHSNTMILLHGRGSNASKFSEPLLSTLLPSGLTFRQSLPHTKFIFPTAPFRRATFANRAVITQWFDSYTLEDVELKPEVQIKGLHDSVRMLHDLVRQEAEVVGFENIVIGGLSLGACTALIAALAWDFEPIAAIVGMAGRLPLAKMLIEASCSDKEEELDDGIVFEDGDIEGDTVAPIVLAANALRAELDLKVNNSSTPIQQIPIFLGHGVLDEKVPIQLGRQAVECFRRWDCDITWREYEALGHWYSAQELEDILKFLQDKRPNILN